MANWKAGGTVFVVLLLIYLFVFGTVFKEYLPEETAIPAMIIGFVAVLIASAMVAAKT